MASRTQPRSHANCTPPVAPWATNCYPNDPNAWFIRNELLGVSQQSGIYVMKIQERYLWHIKHKGKTVEARLASANMARIFPGDIVRFECVMRSRCRENLATRWWPPLCATVKVLSLLKYSSFKEMLEYEGVSNCLPDIANIDEGVQVFHKYPDYANLEPQLGVIAFRITTDINDPTPVPRPLTIVRGGKSTHVLTRQELELIRGNTLCKTSGSSEEMSTNQANIHTNHVHQKKRSRSRELQACTKRTFKHDK